MSLFIDTWICTLSNLYQHFSQNQGQGTLESAYGILFMK